MGPEGVARSELRCQPVAISDPEADLGDSVREETETSEGKWLVAVAQRLGAEAEVESHAKDSIARACSFSSITL